MSTYTETAENVLSKMNVTFKTKFIKHDYHFSEDKEMRDIFRVSFHRGKKSFSLNFGQSLNNSDGNGSNPPTPYDVLACIQKYEPGTFDNFCSDFGYDNDSRKAEKTYKAVVKEFEKVAGFFTPSELEELYKIQ